MPASERTSLLDDVEAVERAAVLLWVEEMAHYPTDPRSRSAARRRWDGTTATVRESWRLKARRVIDAAEGSNA